MDSPLPLAAAKVFRASAGIRRAFLTKENHDLLQRVNSRFCAVATVFADGFQGFPP